MFIGVTENDDQWMNNFYAKPYTRYLPYLLGLLLGYWYKNY